MPYAHSLPFVLKRSKDAMTSTSISTTKETAHGLLRLEGDKLVIQWRLARTTERFTLDAMSSDEEFEEVKEIVVPLSGVAGAVVRRRWWEFFRAPRIVLRASDLQAFEALAGENGLRLAHPAEIVLPVRRRDRLAAEEFAAELELKVAQHGLASGSAPPALGEGGAAPSLPDAAGEE